MPCHGHRQCGVHIDLSPGSQGVTQPAHCTSRTPRTPGVSSWICSVASIRAGATPSMWRHTSRAVGRSTPGSRSADDRVRGGRAAGDIGHRPRRQGKRDRRCGHSAPVHGQRTSRVADPDPVQHNEFVAGDPMITAATTATVCSPGPCTNRSTVLPPCDHGRHGRVCCQQGAKSLIVDPENQSKG